MKTLQLFSAKPETIPISAAWYIADLAEARGRQQLHMRQVPQRLRALREHALIESAVSSNRIEGIEIDQKRVGTIIFGKSLLHDRDEEEVSGYRRALTRIHEDAANIPISGDAILELHRLTRGEIWDAGKYKEKDGDIIEKYSDGRERIRFKTVAAANTPAYMEKLVSLWSQSLEERWVPPLITLAAFNLDFLCIHPFRDGNGRVSRLLLLLQSYQLGYEVGRYISLERLIEQNKDRYYETLEQSSQGWHEGKHDPWPYINYFLFILKTAYREFESRMDISASPRGAKTEIIEAAIKSFPGEFTLADLERACSGVSHDMARKVLHMKQRTGDVICQGRGPGARWKRKGTTPERG
ncbi:filamentation induced by cAMP protein Fic [Smithella sp. SC_K08D17]|jgi:Fic family protein|nr:filamentation induced by cAMP protein Fic [Smithella sp. SC_K08D17]